MRTGATTARRPRRSLAAGLRLRLPGAALLLGLALVTTRPTHADLVAPVLPFQVSTMGIAGDGHGGGNAAIALNHLDGEVLVVWHGTEPGSAIQVWGQRLDATTGVPVGGRLQISSISGSGGGRGWPDVVFNAVEAEYLVVWQMNPGLAGMAPGEYEIVAQRLAADGQLVGGLIRVSDMGPPGDTGYFPQGARVAFNPDRNEYLVVWMSRDDGMAFPEFEVFSQRLDGATGGEIGVDDLRLSDAGGLGDVRFSAFTPDVVYNPSGQFGFGEYLIVWAAHGEAGFDQFEREIFGQRIIASTGLPVGSDDFRISEMGGTGDNGYIAYFPAVAYNAAADEYFVVWVGNDFEQASGEYELFGQRLTGALAAEVGPNDEPLTALGPPATAPYGARAGALDVAYDDLQDAYLVAFAGIGDDVLDDEPDVFAVEVDADGSPVGGSVRVGPAGAPGDEDAEAQAPRLAHVTGSTDHLIVWDADDPLAGLGDDENEVFARRLRLALFADGVEDGSTDRWSAVVP